MPGTRFALAPVLLLVACPLGAQSAGADASPGTTGAQATTSAPPPAALPAQTATSQTTAAQEAPPQITIAGAYPTIAYPEGNNQYQFTVYGQGFSADDPAKDDVWIVGGGSIIDPARHFASKRDCEQKVDPKAKACLWIDPHVPNELHVVGYNRQPDQSRVSVEIVVNGKHYAAKDPLVFSRTTRAGARGWTVLVFFLLAAIMFLLIRKGLKGKTIEGATISPLTALLFDSQTDTYSLSKFQLFFFCAVFIYAYLYCLVCGWLVQGNYTLPDVPLTFAGLLGMSAGTTVVSAGLTQSLGSKGAGAPGPSFSDFISQGGLVVPERFFCFAWTVIACVGFLLLMVSQDPGTASSFPTIPDGLLYVMGVSSAGYLGGKASRGPGPVIRNTAWDGELRVIVAQGENLSYEADMFIDDVKLPIVINAAGKGAAGANASGLITYTAQVPPASDRTLCSELRVTLDPAFTLPALAQPVTQHKLRIVNGDGQFAEAMFS